MRGESYRLPWDGVYGVIPRDVENLKSTASVVKLSTKLPQQQHHMVSKSRTEGRPILLACTQCRLRHLRCDGTLPYCSRCVASNAPCQYLKSRRGGKKKRKTSQDINHGIIHPSGQSEHRPTLEEQTGLGSIEFGAGIGSRASLTQSISSPEIDNRNTEHNLSGTTPPALNPPLDQACGDVSLPEPALVSLYYEHFHNAHPILVPQGFYNERQYPEYLKTAVKLIGNRFLTDRPAASYTNSIQHIRSSEDGTVCLVQSRLLCSIFLCGQGDMELAKSFFISARDLAIDLQIYRYAILETHLLSYGELERESLKRTWWELYVADGYMTTIWPDLRFLTSTLDCDIPLPYDEGSDESQNSTPNCPPLGFDPDILFNEEEEVNLPTWWFRIKAVTLLWKVVSQSGSQAEKQIDDTASQTAMNALATWRLLLPEDKMTLMDPYGQVNKLMFEAETTVQFATILLHLSRSNLTSNTSMSTIISTTGPSLPIRSCTKEVHGIKATEASKDISNLFSIYPSMAKSSPWMISCLSLCGMVQLLTCYAHAPIRNCLETHRDRVRLLIGLLGSSGRIWQQAKTAQNILKTAAQETFQLLRTSKAPQEGPQPEKSSIPSANISSPMSWLPPELSNGNQEIGPWPWLASPSSQLFEAIDPLNNLYSYTADNQLS